MQKGFLPTSQASKLFNQTTSENPHGATVNEGLSGNTHLLKSADHSVAYKNFTGSQIEDTTLVQEAHNKTIQTDWTEEYDPGVTTTLTETAPNVNQQLTLSKSYSKTHTNLTENINTANEAHSINVPNWEAYHQTKQVQIPTKLDQTLSGSGSTTVNNLQSQVQTQNINSQNYTHQFGTLNMNGPATVGGNSVQISGSNINIGGPSQAIKVKLMPSSTQKKNIISSISGSITSNTIKLPPTYNDNYFMNIEIVISGDYELKNTDSLNPLAMSTDPGDIKMAASKVLGDYFINLEVEKSSDLDEALNNEIAPTFTIGNTNGDYTVSGAAKALVYRGVYIFKYTNSLSVEKKACDDWLVTLSGTMDTTVSISKRTPGEDIEIAANDLLDKAISFYHEHQTALTNQIINTLRNNFNQIVDQMYNEAGFLDSITVTDIGYAELAII